MYTSTCTELLRYGGAILDDVLNPLFNEATQFAEDPSMTKDLVEQADHVMEDLYVLKADVRRAAENRLRDLEQYVPSDSTIRLPDVALNITMCKIFHERIARIREHAELIVRSWNQRDT